MTIRGSILSVAFLVAMALSIASQPADADDEALADTLRGVVESHLDAYDREDAAATLATIDSRSPAYQATREKISEQFPELDVKPELVDFAYIGHDAEFAVARVKTKTVAEPGQEEFVGNVTDAIVIFHTEDGVWKLWGEHLLGVVVLPE